MTLLGLWGAVVLALILSAPVTDSAAQPDAGTAPPTPLLEALAFVPDGADPVGFDFVDWAQLKTLHRGSHITSASPLAERHRLLLDITRFEAASMPLGLDRLGAWPEIWGWGTTDLDWEARVFGDFAVMRFGQHWKAEPFRQALAGFGYRAHAFEGGVTYLPDPEAEIPWQLRFANMHGLDVHGQGVTEPMVRLALADDGRTVVFSRTDEAERLLRAGLTADPVRVATTGFGRAAVALGQPVTASILDGRFACSERTNGWLDGEALELAASVAPLHRYEALAAGYTRADPAAPPDGRYVFAYARSQQAHDDLDGRRILIEQGYQYSDDISRYADVAFSLSDARVTGSRLVLDVDPVGGMPVHVLRNVRIRPAVFATCGSVPGQPAA